MAKKDKQAAEAATDETAQAAAGEQEQQQEAAPANAVEHLPVRLTHPYGFMDENDQHRFWQVGHIVTDQAEIALLKERGAPIVEHEAQANV